MGIVCDLGLISPNLASRAHPWHGPWSVTSLPKVCSCWLVIILWPLSLLGSVVQGGLLGGHEEESRVLSYS
jgi:hypothetical protein